MNSDSPEGAETSDQPDWPRAPKPSFNSPAADLNQLRNEAKRIAEAAPGQPVHKAVLDRARALASAIEHDLGLPVIPEGLSYADLAVLLSQSK
ncbi:MAG: hypothetical protein AB7V42_05455 [Thermoleophilia bacterium]